MMNYRLQLQLLVGLTTLVIGHGMANTLIVESDNASISGSRRPTRSLEYEPDKDTVKGSEDRVDNESLWDLSAMSVNVSELVAHWEKGIDSQSSKNETHEDAGGAYPSLDYVKSSFGGLDLSNGLENNITLLRFVYGLTYERQYNKINDYLVKHEPSADYHANIRKANEWLDRQIESGVSVLKNRATVEALEQLVALDTLGKRCDRIGYIVNWRNNRATRGKAHQPPSKFTKAPRRLISVVNSAFLRHATDCLPVYLKTFKTLYESMDPGIIYNVTQAIGRAALNLSDVRSVLVDMQTQEFDPLKLIYSIQSLKDVQDLVSIFRYEILNEAVLDNKFRYMVVDQIRKLWVHDMERIGEMVSDYLVDPCKKFISTLGPDVFIPAKFDLKVLEVDDRSSWIGQDDRDLFVRSWVNYRLCELLVYKDHQYVVDGIKRYDKPKA